MVILSCKRACRLGVLPQQYILSSNIWTKCAKKWTFMLAKPDISDILSQPFSDISKSTKAGLFCLHRLAMTFTPSDQMSL